MSSSSDQTTTAGLCYLTSKGKQLTAGVATSKVLTHQPFPPIGSEGDGRPLHSALIIQRGGPPAFLGKTAAHFGNSANYGHDGNLTESTEKEHYLQLHSCILSSPSSSSSSLQNNIIQSSPQPPPPQLPSSEDLSGQYVWMDAKVLLATSRQLSSRQPQQPTTTTSKVVDLEPLRRFIMYVDGNTGLVSHGGDGGGVTARTHIPIRAHYEGGIHPGQWRVGGEASFGWGGKCQFCTTTTSTSSSQTPSPTTPTISIPFDVLCYRPHIPQVLQPYILLPVRPRYLGRGFGNGPISSISDLLAWRAPSSSSSTPLPLPPIPFPLQHGHGTARRPVVVCHDFKGGYNGSDFPEFVVSTSSSSSTSATSSIIPASDLYTLPWCHVETFIYFTHARVTIPPREWINACHKHGVRCLGTILFEGHDGHVDMIKMLESVSSVNAAVDKFVEVAVELGFDGYLLNCESPVATQSPFQGANDSQQQQQHQVGIMLRLQMFVAFLTQRLHTVLDCDESSVGGGGAARRANVIWYDAITTDGHVSYQNGITNKNVTFAGISDGLFTNYWWRPGHLQVSSSTLALSAPPHQDQSTSSSHHQHQQHPGKYPTPAALLDRKALVGIDVFGRGTYGGGGFSSGEAVKEIVRGSQGQGVALFAPAWTLEVAGRAGRSSFLQADEKFWKGLEDSCGGSGGAGRRGGGGVSPAPYRLFPPPDTTTRTNQQLDISLKTTGVFGGGGTDNVSSGSALGNPFADSKDWGLRRLPYILNFADGFGTAVGGDETSSSSLRWSQLSAGDPAIMVTGGSSSGPLRSIITKPSEVVISPITMTSREDAVITTTTTDVAAPPSSSSSSPGSVIIPLPFRKGLELTFSSLGGSSSTSSSSDATTHHQHVVGSSLLPVCRGPGVTINTTTSTTTDSGGDGSVILYLSVIVESSPTSTPYEQYWYVWVGCGDDVSAHNSSCSTMTLVPLTRQKHQQSPPTSASPRHEMFALDTSSLSSSSSTSTITLFGLATGLVSTSGTNADDDDDDEIEIVVRNLSLYTGNDNLMKNGGGALAATSLPSGLPTSILPLEHTAHTTTTLRQYKDNKYLLDMVLELGDHNVFIFSICVFGRFTDGAVATSSTTSTSPTSLLVLQQQYGMQYLGIHSLEGVVTRRGGVARKGDPNDDTPSSPSPSTNSYFISTAVDMMIAPPPSTSTASSKKPTAMEVCIVPSLWSVPGVWRGDLMQCLTINIT